MDEKRKKALADYYDAATKPEDAQGLITKLTAQINHDYENSSLPSSKCIGRMRWSSFFVTLTRKSFNNHHAYIQMADTTIKEVLFEYRNIFITGATDSGKTYMVCAFGMEACKH